MTRNRAKPLYILGTGLSHDGSACLLKDGRICVAIEKERVTRIKHDGGNDTETIQYCLDAEGITLGDVTLIVQNANWGMFRRGNNWFQGRRLIEDGMPLVTISHHLAHAYGAFGVSPFDESAALVVDGCGNHFDDCIDLEGAIVPDAPNDEMASLYCEKDSYYHFGTGSFQSLYKDFSPWGSALKGYPLYPPTTRHSIGGLYAAVSKYVFGGPMDDSGKLMGLAPYGRHNRYDFEIFTVQDGRVFVNYDWMQQFNFPSRRESDLKSNFQEYADLAWWVQREIERALIYLVRSRYELKPSLNLCYSGGVALNAVANRRIIDECPFKNVFIQPAAGDNGLAVGAAYYGWLAVLKKDKVPHNGSTRFGKRYSERSIEDALAQSADLVSVIKSKRITDETADYIANGKVIAWFQDGSEFGPRALGGRSILADPRSATVRDYINSNVKFREDFRPFAPSILAEDVERFCACRYESPYMLIVASVVDEWRDQIPSVVHQDGTARIHTVRETDSPLYYALLLAFKDRSGIGVLLNTSLNKRRMPIVETPDDAMRFFLTCGLDLLVIGNYVVHKRPPTANRMLLRDLLTFRIRDIARQKRTGCDSLRGIYRFNISTVQQWTVDLSSEDPVVIDVSSSSEPNGVIEADEAHIRSILELGVDPVELIRTGKLRISGDTHNVLRLCGSLRGF